MGIKKQVAEVWFAPTRNRRYFSKEAAASAEARSIIYKKYPREPIEYDTGHAFDIEIDNPEAYEKMHRRLYRKIINEMLISEGGCMSKYTIGYVATIFYDGVATKYRYAGAGEWEFISGVNCPARYQKLLDFVR